MPKIAKELSAIEVKRLNSAGLYAVGGVSGLLLQVAPSGARSWILRATIGGKRRDMGLGGYPDVTLVQAREKAREAKELISNGIDPILQRQTVRANLMASQAKIVTFDECAKRYIASKKHEFRNPKHTAQWESTLQTYASPVIGKLKVDLVEIAHIVEILQPIWLTKTETASRVRGRIEKVLGWATVSGYRTGDNPATWKGRLDNILPAPSKVSKVKHHEALAINEIGQFMAQLREREGISPRALEFCILTAARSGEVRGARWCEIDFNSNIWTIPAERMKAGKEHRVPLSTDAVALLKALPRENELIFPAPRSGKELSDVAMLAVLKRMEYKITGHGFRSTFKDWARERTAYADEVSELALAHVNSDATRAAYARSELIERRSKMMQDWADFCYRNQVATENDKVVNIGGAR